MRIQKTDISQEEVNLWERFKQNADVKAREELIIKYMPLVKHNVGKVFYSVFNGMCSSDDLLSYGYLGLMDAVEKYDVSKNTSFIVYANIRIKGAIIDGIRKERWIPKTLLLEEKKVEKATIYLEDSLGKTPTEKEIAKYLNISFSKLQKIKRNTYYKDVDYINFVLNKENKMTIEDTLAANEKYNPEFLLEENILKKIENFISSTNALTKQQKQVLLFCYYNSLSLREISKILNVTESRVSQIHKTALDKLRENIFKERIIT